MSTASQSEVSVVCVSEYRAQTFSGVEHFSPVTCRRTKPDQSKRKLCNTVSRPQPEQDVPCANLEARTDEKLDSEVVTIFFLQVFDLGSAQLTDWASDLEPKPGDAVKEIDECGYNRWPMVSAPLRFRRFAQSRQIIGWNGLEKEVLVA